MGHYRANVRDLEFNLFEVLDVEKTVGTGEFGDLGAEAIRDMLNQAARQAEGPLAEGFVDGDRNPPTFDAHTHSVTLPEAFKESVRVWHRGARGCALGCPRGSAAFRLRPRSGGPSTSSWSAVSPPRSSISTVRR